MSEGAIVGRLEIPRLKVSVIVIEGVETRDLKRAVGHIPGTPFPGERGNTAVAGHRDSFFRPLRYIHLQDVITITTLRGTFTYRVVSTRAIGPKDIQVLRPTEKVTLTLITCYPFTHVGAAPRRFIVHAESVP